MSAHSGYVILKELWVCFITPYCLVSIAKETSFPVLTLMEVVFTD